MSFDDFCGLTPEEFGCICRAFHDQRETDYKDEWERMRLLAAIVIQPHVKNKLTPEKLLPLPWDKAQQRKQHPAKPMSKEESRRRFERVVSTMDS